MPASSLKSMAKRAGVSMEDAERYWNAAKEAAEDQGFVEGDDDFYAYTMGIVKKRMGLAGLLEVTAQTEDPEFDEAWDAYDLWVGSIQLAKGVTVSDMKRYAEVLDMPTRWSGYAYRGMSVDLARAIQILDNKPFSTKSPRNLPVESWTWNVGMAALFAMGYPPISTRGVGIILKERPGPRTVAVLDHDLFGEYDEILVESDGSQRMSLCRNVVYMLISTELPRKRGDLFKRAIMPSIELGRGDKERMTKDARRAGKFLVFGCDNSGRLSYKGMIDEPIGYEEKIKWPFN